MKFFHGLILAEVSELNDIICIIIRTTLVTVSSLILVNVLSTFRMDVVDSWIFKRGFWLMNSVAWSKDFVSNPENSKKLYVVVYDVFVSILNLETCCSNLAALLVQPWVQTCCSSSILSEEIVGILDTTICLGALLWLFSLLWVCHETTKLTLKVGFICPFVVIDPTN